jgi:hypothetical protein
MSKFCNEKLNDFYTHRLRSLLCRTCAAWNRRPAAHRVFPSSVTVTSSKMASTRRPLLLPPSSPLWPTSTTDSPNGGLLSGSLTREPSRTSQKRSSVSCGFPSFTTPVSALRATSHFTRPLDVRISCNSQLKTSFSHPPHQLSSSTVPGPISRKTSRFRHCSKSPTLSRWLRRRHLRHTTLEPCLRTTRSVTLRCYLRPSLTDVRFC